MNKDGYFYEIKNDCDICFIKKLDIHFRKKLNNYNNIFKYDKNNNKFGLYFSKNTITVNILNELPTQIYINIKYINIGEYNNPIVHILY